MTTVAIVAGNGPLAEIKLVTARDYLNRLDVPENVPAVVTIGEAGKEPQYVLPISVIEDVLRKYESTRS